MPAVLEALEARTLFSTSSVGGAIAAAEAVLLNDARAARANLRQCAPILAADARAAKSALAGVPNSGQNAKLVGQLRADQQKWASMLSGDASALISSGGTAARRVVADGIHLFLHPTDLTFLARLAADLTTLQSAASAPLSKLLNDASSGRSTIVADLNALTAANPNNTQLQAISQKAQTDTGTCLNLANTLTQKAQADVAALIQNLAK